jgi:YwiC-like protein
MAQMTVTLNPATASRTRALWVPREHGAWGMLLVPLVTGAAAAAGGRYLPLLWFTVAAVALFWLRTPVEALLGTSVIRARTPDERRAAWTAVAIISVISLPCLAALFWRGQHGDLLAIGAVAGLAFAIQAPLKRQRRFRAAAEVIGSIGLTSTAASGYYLVTGKFGLSALIVWLINWLFAAEQIEFVQTRIRGAKLANFSERFSRGKSYLVTASLILLAIAVLSLESLAPVLAILAFVPAIVRAGVWFTSKQKTLDVHRLGWLELGNAIMFAVLLVLAYRVA